MISRVNHGHQRATEKKLNGTRHTKHNTIVIFVPIQLLQSPTAHSNGGNKSGIKSVKPNLKKENLKNANQRERGACATLICSVKKKLSKFRKNLSK